MENPTDIDLIARKALSEGEQFFWNVPTDDVNGLSQSMEDVARLIRMYSEGTMVEEFRLEPRPNAERLYVRAVQRLRLVR